MRRVATFTALAGLLLLAACDSDQPPAAQNNTPAATVEAPAAAVPAQPATSNTAAVPAGARPLLGTWAADLAQCGTSAATVSISTTRYESAARSCDVALADAGNGTYSLDCAGDALTLTPVFAPSGEGINISVGGARPETVLRCSR